MKRLTLLFIGLFLLLLGSTSYIQASVFSSHDLPSSNNKPSTQMAVVSPAPDDTVQGDFFVTGVAQDEKEGVKAIEVTFSSMYDKQQTPVREYTANYTGGKWSTHVSQGDLPDDVYSVMVTVHSQDGNKRYLFSTVVVDSTLSTQTTTL